MEISILHKQLARAALSTSLFLPCFYAGAVEQLPCDTTLLLDEITVSTPTYIPPTLKEYGNLQFDAASIGKTHRTLGEADALVFLRSMPGASKASDYASGLSIQGGASYETLFLLQNAPMFFPYHFGGIFSTINAEHYPVTVFEKSIHDLSMPSRVGGLVSQSVRKYKAEKLSGSVNVGMLSSSLNMRTPVGTKADITLSARLSYINSLYSRLLKGNSTETLYDFQDYATTLRFFAAERSVFTLNLFRNNDHLDFIDKNYALDTKIEWHNSIASLDWSFEKGQTAMTHTAYFSEFGNRLSFIMPQLSFDAPSDIKQWAAGGNYVFSIGNGETLKIKSGWHVEQTFAHVQSPETTGYLNESSPTAPFIKQLEGGIYAGVDYSPFKFLAIEGGFRIVAVDNSNGCHVFINPSATIRGLFASSSLSFHFAMYSQSLHQVGFSEIGLASNFWIPSGNTVPIERSRSFALNYTHSFGESGFDFSADAYFRSLTGCTEFKGNILSMLDYDYNALKYVMDGKGRAYGFNFRASKNTGRLTAAVSLAIGKSEINIATLGNGWATATTDPGFEAGIDTGFDINEHWMANAMFSYASGRPVTPIKALYAIGGNIASEYGEPNSARLPTYHRLDLSCTYSFSTKRPFPLRHAINVSILNAYFHDNVEMVRYKYDSRNLVLRQDYMSSLYRFLPSISYTVKF